MAALSAIGPFSLGLACFILALRLRRGLGAANIARGTSISYRDVPRQPRMRASHVNLIIGSAFLITGFFCLFPGPLVLAPIVVIVFGIYPYFQRHKELQDAAKVVAENGKTSASDP